MWASVGGEGHFKDQPVLTPGSNNASVPITAPTLDMIGCKISMTHDGADVRGLATVAMVTRGCMTLATLKLACKIRQSLYIYIKGRPAAQIEEIEPP